MIITTAITKARLIIIMIINGISDHFYRQNEKISLIYSQELNYSCPTCKFDVLF